MTIPVQITSPVTLTQYAQTMPEDSATRIFVENMAKESDLMAAVPFLPATAGKKEFLDIASTPAVGFRGLNKSGGEATGSFNLREEDTYFIDEFVKVDRALLDRLGPQHRIKQEELKTIALAQMFSSVFLKGDNKSDPTQPSGLQVRCTRANIDLFDNSTASGGAALSLGNLDLLHRAVNKPTHWIMPRALLPYFDIAARDNSLVNQAVDYTKDDFGRIITKYKGLPILFGYEPDDTPDMLPMTEVGKGGGSAVTGSIYCVSLRDGGVYAIEQTPLSVRDEGQLPGTNFVSTAIKWDWGIAREHPRSVARLTSVTAAKIVA